MSVNNPMAVTRSIFDAELEKYATLGKKAVYTLNRFNFDVAHSFLIPRAVAYSAGLINYFFRGKIDFVADTNNAGAYLIKNLGPEAMSGDFTLYYDAVDGKRYPVAGDTPTKTWAGRTIAKNGQLGNLSFVVPANPAPKNSGEYMLVFDGDMGEEKAIPGATVGAIAAKQVSTYAGALYLASLDSAGRLLTLKVDQSGTKVLTGFDANGVFQSPDEDDPLYYLFSWSFNQTIPYIKRTKQVGFAKDKGNESYKRLALAVYSRNPWDRHFSFLLDQSNKLRFHGQIIKWVAKSADPLIGDFEFQPRVTSTENWLDYVRRYRDENGFPQVSAGSLRLPDLPVGFNTNYSGLALEGVAVISPDGLSVNGFKGNTQENGVLFNDVFELKIQLAATPTLALVRTEHQSATWTPNPNNTPEPISNTINTGTPPDIYRVSHSEYLYEDTTSSIGLPVYVGYMDGELVSWRANFLYKRTRNWVMDGTYSEVHSNKSGCIPTDTVTYDETQAWRDISGSEGKDEYKLLDGLAIRTSRYFPGYANQAPHFNNNFTYAFQSHRVDQVVCSGGINGGSVVTPGVPIVTESFVSNVENSSGNDLVLSLNGKLQGSVFYSNESGPIFRGQAIPGGEYVADASPLGEVFFARSDLSLIIHEPKPGGMPVLSLPSHVRKLIGALWF